MLGFLDNSLIYCRKIIFKFTHPFWFIGFFYLAFIAYASLRPLPLITQADLPETSPEKLKLFLDKILHCGAYGIAGLWFKGLSSKTKIIIFSLFVFGALMEIGQYFIPSRSFQVLDFFANLSGIYLGAILASFLGINWFIIFDRIRR